MVTAILGPGTLEATWQEWPGLHRLPALDLAGCDRVVLVAPHPDDEVLGCGGLLRRLAHDGVPVEVVAVTDGEASHPHSPTVAPAALATLRAAESTRALDRLGLGVAGRHRIGAPDGGVAGVEQRLTAALTDVLGSGTPATWCLATWAGDGHPDHEAVGRAAASACRRTGARLVEYPIWMWHWAVPDDARVPWSRARSVSLRPREHEAKLAAVECFDTQVRELSDQPGDEVLLGPGLLARLTRTFEVVFA